MLPIRGWIRVACVVVVTATAAVRSAPAQSITRVSTAADGSEANGASTQPAFSADGRWAAFSSRATNLVAGDANGSADVFVKDLQTGAVQRVSVAPDGSERTGDSGIEGVAINADGTLVAFTSRAALVANDTNVCAEMPDSGAGPSCTDIYLRNVTLGQTVQISVDALGTQANGPSVRPAMSAAGTRIVFTSTASNLVPFDTNGSADVFVRDVSVPSTTRVSVSSAGVEAALFSDRGGISADGRSAVFVSPATNLTTDPAPTNCPGNAACLRGFLRDLDAGTTIRMPLSGGVAVSVQDITISPDGRYVAQSYAHRVGILQFFAAAAVLVYDRVTSQLTPPLLQVVNGLSLVPGDVALSTDGRVVVMGASVDDPASPAPFEPLAYDNAVGAQETIDLHPSTGQPVRGLKLTADGRHFVVASVDPLVAGDGNGVSDIFLVSRDRDEDGMADTWETAYGLDPASAADAALDPDSDGRTNLQEYTSNTHPNGRFRQYFAEGVSNVFFQTFILVANAADASMHVQSRLQGDDGSEQSRVQTIAGGGTFSVSNVLTGSYSMVLESAQPLLSERQVTWNVAGSGGMSGESGIAAPALEWHFAEGATHGRFDLFYLLQNPTDTAANVTIDYLRPPPLAPVSKQYLVPAHSRRTIYVDQEGPELEATDVSAKITSDRPLVVERSMYLSTPAQSFIGGHSGAGITTPGTRWFLAEGATGMFFDTYVLISPIPTPRRPTCASRIFSRTGCRW